MKSLSLILFIYLGVIISLPINKYKSLDSLLKVAETAKDTAFVNSLIQIATVYKYKDTDTAMYYLNIAEKEAGKIDYAEGLLNTLYLKGNILYFNNNYPKANKYFKQGLNFSGKTNSKLFKAKFLERLASLNLSTGNPNLALKQYYESLVIFEELNDKKGIAKVYNILGVYKTEIKEYDTAESYLMKSLYINRQLKDTLNIIENKNNLGLLYEKTGEIEKAEETYRELIPTIRKSGNIFALPVIYYNLASINQRRGENKLALKFLQKAIHLSEQQNDTILLSNLYGNKGELMMLSGNIDSARFFLERSVLFSKSIGEVETEIHALKLLAHIDSLSNDFVTALKTLKLISVLKDTLYDRRLKNSLKESELEYEKQK